MNKTTAGFTLVELLIVIVVVGILAAIALVSYNGITTRAQNTKIASDISQIYKTIVAARDATGGSYKDVSANGVGKYGNGGISAACLSSGYTDLTSAASAPRCWETWNILSDNLFSITGTNLSTIKDPWGQPYMVVTRGASCTSPEIFAVKPPINGWGSKRAGQTTLPPPSDCQP